MLPHSVFLEQTPLREIVETVIDRRTEVPLAVSDLFDNDEQQAAVEKAYQAHFESVVNEITAIVGTDAVMNGRCAEWRTPRGNLHLSLDQEDRFLPLMLILSCSAA